MDFILAPAHPESQPALSDSLVASSRYLVVLGQLEGWSDALRARFKPKARLTRGLKTEVEDLNFVRLMAHNMA